MITVLLGTQKHEFNRLIKYIKDICIKENIKDTVIIQTGENRYDDIVGNHLPNIKLKSYLEDYKEVINKSDFIICHGGVGVIMDCLEQNKKVITIPRLNKYKEHVDDHQLEICQKLSKDNYILNAVNKDEFEWAFLNIKNIEFKKYKSNNKKFNIKLNDLINEVMGE